MTGPGGVGSVAGVQNNLTAISELSHFETPLSVSLIDTAQDWQTRQKISYAGIAGLIAADFLSLDDWAAQISQYSHANPQSLSGPYASIVARLKKNGIFTASQLTPDPELGGLVGQFLRLLPFFADVFIAQPELLSNQSGLSSALGVA